jgi:RHS repeat-associated protein
VIPAASIPAVVETTRYSFTGGGDSPDFTLNGSNVVQERTLALPGGVTVSVQASSQVWSYPNLHGDVIVTANGTGTRQGGVVSYDPFGQPVDPVTGNIGTLTADDASPSNTTTGSANYGWEGSHQKLFEHAGDVATIEMGARQYIPALGRFLEVDPVAGGNANDYNYPNDPINGSDLTGKAGFDWLDLLDNISGVLGVAALFGCTICGIASSAISLGVGIYKVANGDASGWIDIGSAATLGVGKALRVVSKVVTKVRLAAVPKFVRGSALANAAKRAAIKSGRSAFRRNVARPVERGLAVYGAVSSAKWAYDKGKRYLR